MEFIDDIRRLNRKLKRLDEVTVPRIETRAQNAAGRQARTAAFNEVTQNVRQQIPNIRKKDLKRRVKFTPGRGRRPAVMVGAPRSLAAIRLAEGRQVKAYRAAAGTPGGVVVAGQRIPGGFLAPLPKGTQIAKRQGKTLPIKSVKYTIMRAFDNFYGTTRRKYLEVYGREFNRLLNLEINRRKG